jgi:Uma2 family endonuclease
MATHPAKTREELIEELYQLPDHMKAEIVDGAIVRIGPSGGISSRVSGLILVSMWEYSRRTGIGFPLGAKVGFVVDLPNRWSFCPDASFTIGQVLDEEFVRGAPVFAVEVRDMRDYGPEAERAIQQKLADYIAAGTQVVWDVDPLCERVVRVYRASDPDHPTLYREGDEAEAEPALPGWRPAINDFMEKPDPPVV